MVYRAQPVYVSRCSCITLPEKRQLKVFVVWRTPGFLRSLSRCPAPASWRSRCKNGISGSFGGRKTSWNCSGQVQNEPDSYGWHN